MTIPYYIYIYGNNGSLDPGTFESPAKFGTWRRDILKWDGPLSVLQWQHLGQTFLRGLVSQWWQPPTTLSKPLWSYVVLSDTHMNMYTYTCLGKIENGSWKLWSDYPIGIQFNFLFSRRIFRVAETPSSDLLITQGTKEMELSYDVFPIMLGYARYT